VVDEFLTATIIEGLFVVDYVPTSHDRHWFVTTTTHIIVGILWWMSSWPPRLLRVSLWWIMSPPATIMIDFVTTTIIIFLWYLVVDYVPTRHDYWGSLCGRFCPHPPTTIMIDFVTTTIIIFLWYLVVDYVPTRHDYWGSLCGRFLSPPLLLLIWERFWPPLSPKEGQVLKIQEIYISLVAGRSPRCRKSDLKKAGLPKKRTFYKGN
jgi:hypothetical protein